jgi:prevent-host-death family protein
VSGFLELKTLSMTSGRAQPARFQLDRVPRTTRSLECCYKKDILKRYNGSVEVGIRELRAGLSRFVKRVEAGDEIVITDHGKPVARIVPIGERKIDRLIRSGDVIPARRPWHGPLPEPIEGGGPLSDIVLGDRR